MMKRKVAKHLERAQVREQGQARAPALALEQGLVRGQGLVQALERARVLELDQALAQVQALGLALVQAWAQVRERAQLQVQDWARERALEQMLVQGQAPKDGAQKQVEGRTWTAQKAGHELMLAHSGSSCRLGRCSDTASSTAIISAFLMCIMWPVISSAHTSHCGVSAQPIALDCLKARTCRIPIKE
jgi:hypothetical protein